MSIFDGFLIMNFLSLDLIVLHNPLACCEVTDFIQMSLVRNRCGNREKLLLIKNEQKNRNKSQDELALSL